MISTRSMLPHDALPRGSGTAWTLWIALAVATSPVLLDLADHVAAHSWAWYVVVFPPLFALSITRVEVTRPRPVLAIACLFVGLAVELVAIASGQLRSGRIAVLLCVLGMLWLEGRMRWRPTVLLVLCIPIPSFVLERLGESLLFLVAQPLAGTIRWTGSPALARAGHIDLPGESLLLVGSDLGWQTGLLAFGITWFVGLAAGRGSWPTLRAASVLGLLAQIVHIVATIGLLSMWVSAGWTTLELARSVRDVAAYSLTLAAVICVNAMNRRNPSEGA